MLSSFDLLAYFLSKKSKILSPANKRPPPKRKPIDTTKQGIISKFSAISNAGDNKDQNAAAIITPAEKPSIPSITVLFTFLKKNTKSAPSIVTLHVKRVAINACNTGFKLVKKSNIIKLLHSKIF